MEWKNFSHETINLLWNYFSTLRSSVSRGQPMEVSCAMQLLDINEIDAADFSFSVSVALKFAWVDNRVVMLSPDTDLDPVNVDLAFVHQLWTPDFYIYDLQHFRRMTIFKDQGGLRVKKRGNNDTGRFDYCIARLIATLPLFIMTSLPRPVFVFVMLILI